MLSDRQGHCIGMPTTLRLPWMALALVAALPVLNKARAETRIVLVVGETYRQNTLICRSPAARNALIVRLQQGMWEPLPQGCSSG